MNGSEPTALLDIREAFVDFPCVFPLLAVLLQLSMSDSLGLLSSSFVDAFDLRRLVFLTPLFNSVIFLLGRRDPVVPAPGKECAQVHLIAQINEICISNRVNLQALKILFLNLRRDSSPTYTDPV